MKIYMIRHGETDWNRELRLQGREDVPLNAAGKIQAAVCGDALKGLGIQAVFTSPLSRARLTGEILAGRIGLDPGAVLTGGDREVFLPVFDEFPGEFAQVTLDEAVHGQDGSGIQADAGGQDFPGEAGAA